MKKVLIITGSRSEWGILEPLAVALTQEDGFDVSVLPCASHLSPEFGLTVSQIQADVICDQVETLLSSDTSIGVCKSMGLGLISGSEALKRARPDLVIIEGDRSEALAMALCAYNLGIPIAHIGGGDVTRGSLDNGYRGCITQLAAMHFPDTDKATQELAMRVPGHSVEHIYDVGSLSLEGLAASDEYRDGAILAIHPTFDIGPGEANLIQDVLYDYCVIATSAGADAGGRAINDQLIGLTQMDRDKFLRELASVLFIIGNSSAGIVEAPFLGTPTINIGARQQGRPMASSIIQAEPTAESIQAAIAKLQSEEFQESLRAGIYLEYTGGNVVERIVSHIKEFL